MYRKLILTLPEDTLLLTPNRRLALTLTELHHQLKKKTVSKPPKVFSLSDWLRELFYQLNTDTYLLSSLEEQLMWQEIIEAHSGDELLLPSHRIAQQVISTCQLIESFQVSLSDDDMLTHNDGEQFLIWLNAFKAKTDKENYITQAQLPSLISQSLENIALPEKILLVGFVDPPPAITSLVNSISACCHITWHKAEKQENTLSYRAEFANPQSELRAMAAWAKNIWESHPKPKECKIACIAPNLHQDREQITRTLWDMLTPTGDPFSQKPPFNISQGRALIDYPIIKTAFDCLKAHNNHRDTTLISSLLCNPYITSYSEEDSSISAQIDSDLRRDGLTQASNQRILSLMQTYLDNENTNSALLKRWDNYLAHISHTKSLASHWCDHLSSLLKAIEWPGQQALNSEEFQLRERWQKALLDIASLDDMLGEITQSRFTGLFHQYLSQNLFQPQAHSAPIHVLGLLEASGLAFDAVWIMGLDNATWPAQPQPDPYLPTHIQRHYNLPQSSPNREREFSLMHQRHIQSGTPLFIVSSSRRHGDIPREPSVLITDLPEMPEKKQRALESKLPFYTQWIDPDSLEQGTFNQAPPLSKTDGAIKGGSAILNEQARCPFRSFALFRLHAKQPQTARFNVNPAIHGIVVHSALELIWHQLKTQAVLLKLSQDEKEKLIETTANRVIKQQHCIPKRLRHAHTIILQRALNNWLNLEKSRTPFKVLETEKRELVFVGKYHITVRLDRVDELPDGKLIIIDYKTGSPPSLMQCIPPQATENQLPLYASFSRHQSKTIGFAFASTHPEHMGWSGVISDDYAKALPLTQVAKLKGEALDWATLQNQWKTHHLSLLDDFASGVADIAPAQASTTCRYCECRPICRIGLSK